MFRSIWFHHQVTVGSCVGCVCSRAKIPPCLMELWSCCLYINSSKNKQFKVTESKRYLPDGKRRWSLYKNPANLQSCVLQFTGYYGASCANMIITIPCHCSVRCINMSARKKMPPAWLGLALMFEQQTCKLTNVCPPVYQGHFSFAYSKMRVLYRYRLVTAEQTVQLLNELKSANYLGRYSKY